MDEKKLVEYRSRNSDEKLLDNMKAIGMKQSDMKILMRLPINRESMFDLVDKMTLAKIEEDKK
jgi:hypothetical protein